MTTKQKTAVIISAFVLAAGAGYLYYEFVWKPKHKSGIKPDETKKTDNSSTVITQPEKPVSQYGFKPGDMLWTKPNVVNVYNYPESLAKYRVGFIKKQAQSQAKFIADAGTKGFVKANTVYFTPDGTQKKIADVYIPADQLTNVAP